MKNVLIGCSVVALLLLAIGAGGIWFFLFRVQPLADASMEIPSEAEIDSTISMVITATNPHPDAVIMESIDVADSFLDGFQVVSVDPTPEETMDIPFVDMRSWMFNKSLAPGESQNFTFTLRPVLIGHYSGDVDVCNPNQDFVTLLADVVVRNKVGGNEDAKPKADKPKADKPKGDKPKADKAAKGKKLPAEAVRP